jgi:hypothetical protein
MCTKNKRFQKALAHFLNVVLNALRVVANVNSRGTSSLGWKCPQGCRSEQGFVKKLTDLKIKYKNSLKKRMSCALFFALNQS